MSLSSPVNPPFVTTSAVAPVPSSVGMLNATENSTLINQLHGVTSNNAIGEGIPKQVTNVQVSIANAQTGATCTISVLYSIDPSDKNFAGVNIWVKGYQGNNQLVQVASGTSSPAKFVLNNTGETVSFTIQAYGNGGTAPLTASPTCSGILPQSTTGGYGSSTTNYYNVNNPPPSGTAVYYKGLIGATVAIQNSASYTVTGINQVTTEGATGVVRGNATDPQGVSYTTSSAGGSSAGIYFFSTIANEISIGNFILFEGSLLLPDITNIRVWIGLSDTVTTTGLVPMKADIPNGNNIAFRYSTAAGDTKWMCVTSISNAAFTATAESGSHLDTNRHIFKIEYDGANALFYIDGTLVCTQAANLPSSAALFNVVVCCDNVGLGNAKVFKNYYTVVLPR